VGELGSDQADGYELTLGRKNFLNTVTRMMRIQRMLRREIHGAAINRLPFSWLSFSGSVTAVEPGCARGDIRPIRVIRVQVWTYRT